MSAPSLAYIGIGSNVGDKLGYCQKAISFFSYPDIVLTAVSSLYETAPVDYLDQDWFYNAVAAVVTTLSPSLLIKRCQEIERQLGKNIKILKGPRTIDLDILFYQDVVIDSPELTVPHPSALTRAFVLVPMAEIAPHFVPQTAFGNQKTMKEICEDTLESLVEGGTVVRKKQCPNWIKVNL